MDPSGVYKEEDDFSLGMLGIFKDTGDYYANIQLSRRLVSLNHTCVTTNVMQSFLSCLSQDVVYFRSPINGLCCMMPVARILQYASSTVQSLP